MEKLAEREEVRPRWILLEPSWTFLLMLAGDAEEPAELVATRVLQRAEQIKIVVLFAQAVEVRVEESTVGEMGNVVQVEDKNPQMVEMVGMVIRGKSTELRMEAEVEVQARSYLWVVKEEEEAVVEEILLVETDQREAEVVQELPITIL